MVAHEFDVFRVVLYSILECKGNFFGIDGEDWHSIVEQFFVKLVVLEFLPPDEAFDSLLEDVLAEYLVVLELVGKLRMAQD